MGEYWRLEPTECLDCKLRSSYPCAGAQGVRRAEFPLRTLGSQRSLADSLTALLHEETTVSPTPFADPPFIPAWKGRDEWRGIKSGKRSDPGKLRLAKTKPPRDRGGFLSAKLRRNNQPNQRAVCGGTTFMTFCFCMSIC